MAGPHRGTRLLRAALDPWALLLAAFGGGTAWAVGAAMPLCAGTAGVMLATAAVVGVLTRATEGPARLRRGTPQQGLIDVLDGHLRSVRTLQSQALAPAVRAKADDALAAATAARPFVERMATAVDALDESIAAARDVAGRGADAAQAIARTVARLGSRRARLLDRLTAAVDEVATVYAGLLELSATARTMGVGLDDTEVGAVNDSITMLRITFAELEADAASLPEHEPL